MPRTGRPCVTTPVPPCAKCRTTAGQVGKGASRPSRHSGARFGLGPLCLKCYDALRRARPAGDPCPLCLDDPVWRHAPGVGACNASRYGGPDRVCTRCYGRLSSRHHRRGIADLRAAGPPPGPGAPPARPRAPARRRSSR